MLFADRTSTAFLRSNQIRLYFSSMAYVLMEALRRLGLKQTELARAQASTIRPKLLKIGALIRITVRKVWVSLAEGYPYAKLFAQACAQLRASPAPCSKTCSPQPLRGQPTSRGRSAPAKAKTHCPEPPGESSCAQNQLAPHPLRIAPLPSSSALAQSHLKPAIPFIGEKSGLDPTFFVLWH